MVALQQQSWSFSFFQWLFSCIIKIDAYEDLGIQRDSLPGARLHKGDLLSSPLSDEEKPQQDSEISSRVWLAICLHKCTGITQLSGQLGNGHFTLAISSYNTTRCILSELYLSWDFVLFFSASVMVYVLMFGFLRWVLLFWVLGVGFCCVLLYSWWLPQLLRLDEEFIHVKGVQSRNAARPQRKEQVRWFRHLIRMSPGWAGPDMS